MYVLHMSLANLKFSLSYKTLGQENTKQNVPDTVCMGLVLVREVLHRTCPAVYPMPLYEFS